MATRIPPHNLGEAIDACIALIDDPQADPLESMQAPDFPTGGILMGRSGAVEAYRTGRGRITIRARCEIVEDGKHSVIYVTELPYQVNKARLIERMAQMVKEKRLEGISDLRDESDKSGMRIRIAVHPSAQADVVLNHLYQSTDLQVHFGMNLVALHKGAPRTLTLREMLRIFLDHRRDVVTRRSRFEKQKAEARAHILEGLLLALDHLDDLIHLIRNAPGPADAKAQMLSRIWHRDGEPVCFTDPQAQAILDLRLHRLTGMERDKIALEFSALRKEIERLDGILSDEGRLMAVVRSELEVIRNAYAGPRKTEIGEETADLQAEDLVPNTDIVVTMTHAGYIKAQPVEEFRAQGRGGRGKQATGLRDGDFVERLFRTTNHARILFFSDTGRVYARKGYEIPMAARTARGKTIQSILPLAEKERITAMLAVPADAGAAEEDDTASVALLTRNGIGKRLPVSHLVKFRQNGTTAIGLAEDDALIAAFLTNGNRQILLLTQQGKAIRFCEDDIREMGKQARGVRVARLAIGDRVVSAMPVCESDSVLIVSERGFGKVTGVSGFRLTARRSKGVTAARVEKSGPVAGGVVVGSSTDDVLLLSQQGVLVRIGAATIPESSRTAKGARLMRLDEGDAVASVELVPITDVE
jgi:DNA gyrase subunit A